MGEVRFDILNVTNTPKFRAIDSNAIDVSSFGSHHRAGRVHADLQLTFRYRF